MKNKKSGKRIFTILFSLLFLSFLVLYISQINGYYEYKAYVKTTITEEAMEKFERDVAEGKDININDYLEGVYKDYSNDVSNLGLKAGNAVESFMSKGIKRTFKILGTLFLD